MRFVQSVALAAAVAAFPQATLGQGIPLLVGTWKATAYAVSVGSNPYRTPETKEPNFPSDALEFTFVIREQRDNRFSGQSTIGNKTETLIGGISPDNKSGVVLDDDGEYLFTIRDNDTLDACYRHLYPATKVVSCYSWKRQK
jgi:hypothetical protein